MLFTGPVLNFVLKLLPEFNGNYLEIGILEGDSVVDIAEKFPNKTIFAVDPFIEDGNTNHYTGVETNKTLTSIRNKAVEKINKHKNIMLFEQSSVDFAKQLTAEDIDKYNINIVFIDGNHHYDYVLNDLELARKLLNNKNGVIIIDDTQVNDVSHAITTFNNRINLLKEKHIIWNNAVSYRINNA